ncbi:hypothetical protein QOT17_007552 [Balamuthia mandrillaris]
MSDSNFSSIVHRRRCLNDIVDAHWEADGLPNDDIVLPPELSLNSDSLEEKVALFLFHPTSSSHSAWKNARPIAGKRGRGRLARPGPATVLITATTTAHSCTITVL